MAKYSEAVAWIALEDGPGDTSSGLDFEEVFSLVDGNLTVAMVADLWHMNRKKVAVDVLKARGFAVPRGFLSTLE